MLALTRRARSPALCRRACSYGVVVDDCPCEILLLKPDKLRRMHGPPPTDESTPTPSADVTNLLASLVPIGDMDAAADACDGHGRSPEILFCRQYEEPSPIIDVTHVDEVRRL